MVRFEKILLCKQFFSVTSKSTDQMLDVKNVFVTDKASFQCGEYFFHLNQKVPQLSLDQPTKQTIGHTVTEIATGYNRSQTCFDSVPQDSPNIKQFSNNVFVVFYDQITGDHWVYHIESNTLVGYVKKSLISNQNKVSHAYLNPLDENFFLFHCEDDRFYALYISDNRGVQPVENVSSAKVTVSPFLKLPKSVTSKVLKSGKEKPLLVQFHPVFPMLFVGFSQGSILVWSYEKLWKFLQSSSAGGGSTQLEEENNADPDGGDNDEEGGGDVGGNAEDGKTTNNVNHFGTGKSSAMWSFIGSLQTSYVSRKFAFGNIALTPTYLQFHNSGQLAGVVLNHAIVVFYDLSPLTTPLNTQSTVSNVNASGSFLSFGNDNNSFGINLMHCGLFPLVANGNLCIPGDSFANGLSSTMESTIEYSIHSLHFHPLLPFFSLCILRKQYFPNVCEGNQNSALLNTSLFRHKSIGGGNVLDLFVPSNTSTIIPLVPVWYTFSMLSMLTSLTQTSSRSLDMDLNHQEIFLPLGTHELAEIAPYNATAKNMEEGYVASHSVNYDPLAVVLTPSSHQVVIRYKMVTSYSTPAATSFLQPNATEGLFSYEAIGNILAMKEEHVVFVYEYANQWKSYEQKHWLWYSQQFLTNHLSSTPLSVFFYGLPAWSKYSYYESVAFPTKEKSNDRWNTITSYECKLSSPPTTSDVSTDTVLTSRRLGLPTKVLLQPVYLPTNSEDNVGKNGYSLHFQVLEVDVVQNCLTGNNTTTTSAGAANKAQNNSKLVGIIPTAISETVAKQMILSTYSWCQLPQSDYWLPETEENRSVNALSKASLLQTLDNQENDDAIEVLYQVFPHEVQVWEHGMTANLNHASGEKLVSDLFEDGIICVKAKLVRSYFSAKSDGNVGNSWYYHIDSSGSSGGMGHNDHGTVTSVVLLMKYSNGIATLVNEDVSSRNSLKIAASDNTAVVLNFKDAAYLPASGGASAAYKSGTVLALNSRGDGFKILQLRNSVSKKGQQKTYLNCIQQISLESVPSFISIPSNTHGSNHSGRLEAIWVSNASSNSTADLYFHGIPSAVGQSECGSGGEFCVIPDIVNFFHIPTNDIHSITEAPTTKAAATTPVVSVNVSSQFIHPNACKLKFYRGEKVLQWAESRTFSTCFDSKFQPLQELIQAFQLSSQDQFVGILTTYRVIIAIYSTETKQLEVINSVQYSSPTPGNFKSVSAFQSKFASKKKTKKVLLNESVVAIHWLGMSLLILTNHGRVHYLLPCPMTNHVESTGKNGQCGNKQFLQTYLHLLGTSNQGGLTSTNMLSQHHLRSQLNSLSLFFTLPRNLFATNPEAFSSLPLLFALPDRMLFFIPAGSDNVAPALAVSSGSGDKRIIFSNIAASCRPINPWEVILLGIIGMKLHNDQKQARSQTSKVSLSNTPFNPFAHSVSVNKEFKTHEKNWFDLAKTILLYYTTNHNNQSSSGSTSFLPRTQPSQHLMTTLSLLNFLQSPPATNTNKADEQGILVQNLWSSVVFPLMSNPAVNSSLSFSNYLNSGSNGGNGHYHNFYMFHYMHSLLVSISSIGSKPFVGQDGVSIVPSRVVMLLWMYQLIVHYQVPAWYDLFIQQDTYGGSQLPLPSTVLSNLLVQFAGVLEKALDRSALLSSNKDSFSSFLLQCLDMSGNTSELLKFLVSTWKKDESLWKLWVEEVSQEDWTLLTSTLRQYVANDLLGESEKDLKTGLHVELRNSINNLYEKHRKKSLWACLVQKYVNVHDLVGKLSEPFTNDSITKDNIYWKLFNRVNRSIPMRALGPIPPTSASYKVSSATTILARDTIEEYFGNICSLELLTSPQDNNGSNLLGLFDDPSQNGSDNRSHDVPKFFPGQPLPVSWVENVGVMNQSGGGSSANRECEKVVAYYRFSDGYFPNEVGYTNSCLPPTIVTLVDLSRYESQSSQMELFDGIGQDSSDDTHKSQYSIEYTTSSIHPGEKHESMKLLCDIVHTPPHSPPMLNSKIINSSAGPVRVMSERIEHGLRCVVYRGGPLDVGMYHFNPSITASGSNPRNVCTMEWHWSCSNSVEELRQELSYKPIVLLQRSVYPSQGLEEKKSVYDDLIYPSGGNSGMNGENCLIGVVWRLFINSDGYLVFAVGSSSGESQSIVSNSTIFAMMQNAYLAANAFNEDDSAADSTVPFLHMAFTLDSSQSNITSTVMGSETSVKYQSTMQVQLLVNNQVALDNITANKSNTLLPSFNESLLDTTLLYVLPNCPLTYRLTEFRVWSGSKRSLQQLLDFKEQFLSLGEKRYRLMMQYKGTKKLFGAYREFERLAANNAATADLLLPSKKSGSSGAAGNANGAATAASSATSNPSLLPFAPPPVSAGRRGSTASGGLLAKPQPSSSLPPPISNEDPKPTANVPVAATSSLSAPVQSAALTARQRRLSQLQQKQPDSNAPSSKVASAPLAVADSPNSEMISDVTNKSEPTVSQEIKSVKPTFLSTDISPTMATSQATLPTPEVEKKIVPTVGNQSVPSKLSSSEAKDAHEEQQKTVYVSKTLKDLHFDISMEDYCGIVSADPAFFRGNGKFIHHPTILFRFAHADDPGVVNAIVLEAVFTPTLKPFEVVAKRLSLHVPSDVDARSMATTCSVALLTRSKPTHPYIIAVISNVYVLFFDISIALYGKPNGDTLPEGRYLGKLPTAELSHGGVNAIPYAFFLTAELLVYLTHNEGFTIKINPATVDDTGVVSHGKPMKILNRIDITDSSSWNERTVWDVCVSPERWTAVLSSNNHEPVVSLYHAKSGKSFSFAASNFSFRSPGQVILLWASTSFNLATNETQECTASIDELDAVKDESKEKKASQQVMLTVFSLQELLEFVNSTPLTKKFIEFGDLHLPTKSGSDVDSNSKLKALNVIPLSIVDPSTNEMGGAERLLLPFFVVAVLELIIIVNRRGDIEVLDGSKLSKIGNISLFALKDVDASFGVIGDSQDKLVLNVSVDNTTNPSNPTVVFVVATISGHQNTQEESFRVVLLSAALLKSSSEVKN